MAEPDPVKVNAGTAAAKADWIRQWTALMEAGIASPQDVTFHLDWPDCCTEAEHPGVARGVQMHATTLTALYKVYFVITSTEQGMVCQPDDKQRRVNEFQAGLNDIKILCDLKTKELYKKYPEFAPKKSARPSCAHAGCEKHSDNIIMVESRSVRGAMLHEVKSKNYCLTGPFYCVTHAGKCGVPCTSFKANSRFSACICCGADKQHGDFLCYGCDGSDDINQKTKRGETLMAKYMEFVCYKYGGSASTVDFGDIGMYPDGVWVVYVNGGKVYIVIEQDGKDHATLRNLRDALKPFIVMDKVRGENARLIFARVSTVEQTHRNIHTCRGWILWLLCHIEKFPELMPRFVYLLVSIPGSHYSTWFPAKAIAVRDPPIPTTMTFQGAYDLEKANRALGVLRDQPVTKQLFEMAGGFERKLGNLWFEVHSQGCLSPALARTVVNEFVGSNLVKSTGAMPPKFTWPSRNNIEFQFPMCDIRNMRMSDGVHPGDITNSEIGKLHPQLPDVDNTVSAESMTNLLEICTDKVKGQDDADARSLKKVVEAVRTILDADSKKTAKKRKYS